MGDNSDTYIGEFQTSSFGETMLNTANLAFWTTVILLIIGLPISYWLAFSRCKIKPFFEALLCMPMVLPPTVMGFYILMAISPVNFFGRWLEEWFDVRLAFSFSGVLLASVLTTVPYMVQPLQNGLMALPESLREASYTMGKSKLTTFFRILLPNIKHSLISAIAMTFAHVTGEFGVILMVGGMAMNGPTRVASIAIYDEVQSMQYSVAGDYALILFLVSFTVLIIIYSSSKINKLR